MPVISRFYGILIAMYFNDHNPPHFHAKYSGYEAMFGFDGTAGEVDLDGVLTGPVFDVLKDLNVFKKVAVDPELETVVWPNGADLASEFLKELYEKQVRLV